MTDAERVRLVRKDAELLSLYEADKKAVAGHGTLSLEMWVASMRDLIDDYARQRHAVVFVSITRTDDDEAQVRYKIVRSGKIADAGVLDSPKFDDWMNDPSHTNAEIVKYVKAAKRTWESELGEPFHEWNVSIRDER